jgi:chemotaxis family two-component system response regulator Rcp1
MRKTSHTILVIEDCVPDFELLKKALVDTAAGIFPTIVNVASGEAAVRYLFKKEGYEKAKTPDLIILDLNLPTISGQEVLGIIKTTPALKRIPVIIFSTSDAEKDIKECYDMYANSYITKTFDVAELFTKVASISDYWLRVTELPDATNVVFVNNNIPKENT